MSESEVEKWRERARHRAARYRDLLYGRTLPAEEQVEALRAEVRRLRESGPVYVKREMRWSAVIELARELYVLDWPTRDDFDRDFDPEVTVFVRL